MSTFNISVIFPSWLLTWNLYSPPPLHPHPYFLRTGGWEKGEILKVIIILVAAGS